MQNQKAVKYYEQGTILQQKGKLPEAERAYRKAIKTHPKFVEALNNLGNVLLDRGRIKEAGVCFGKAQKLLPEHPMLLHNLGNALQLQGENEKAVRWYQQAVALNTGFVGTYINLGNALRMLERFQEAVTCYRRALEIDPQHADSYTNLGGVSIDLGDLDAAVINFKHALALDPSHLEANYGLGNALGERGQTEAAINAYRKVIAIDPEYEPAYIALGNAFNAMGDIDAAIQTYNQALKFDPQNKNACNGLAQALSDQGETDAAIDTYRRVIEIDPGNKEAYNGLAKVLSDMGEIDAAIGIYHQSLEIEPQAHVYRSLTKNKKFSEYDDDLRAMESFFAATAISDEDKMHLAFGLGKAYEDLRQYEKSMDFILEANRLKRATLDYSMAESQESFANIKASFSAAFFAQREGIGNPDQTPIFILGMPRSGTSLVEQILASHPNVFGAGELSDLARLTRLTGNADASFKFPAGITDLDAPTLAELGQQYINRIRHYSSDARHITDKMPHNFLYIGLIRTILPNAKVIHCSRDPMDTCLSLFKNYFSQAINYSYDLTELGLYYNLYRELMTHWHVTLPGFIYNLGYEELVTEPETRIRSLLGFCGLPWDENCLDFHQTRRKVRTASNAQVRRPIYRDSVKLWRRYEKQLQPLRLVLDGIGGQNS